MSLFVLFIAITQKRLLKKRLKLSTDASSQRCRLFFKQRSRDMRPGIFLALITTACAITGCAGHQEHQPYAVAEQTYVHKYGTTVPSHDWTSRGGHGKVISALNNGVIVSRTYTAGVLDGESTYTFPHSETLEHVEIYSQGTLIKNILYYPQGAPSEEMLYQSNGEKERTC